MNKDQEIENLRNTQWDLENKLRLANDSIGKLENSITEASRR